ncbi:hypothetical protein EVAR_7224_1 [Eumeta japonica]|uniref:Uncharacterized protein n=1 Tax=Eumeta variegata TaxID=151549 RepID=A0A4C1T339_EUMVA|nr:hypothetical protein EVAR_7224_1 [Eumeta japonica]
MKSANPFSRQHRVRCAPVPTGAGFKNAASTCPRPFAYGRAHKESGRAVRPPASPLSRVTHSRPRANGVRSANVCFGVAPSSDPGPSHAAGLANCNGVDGHFRTFCLCE